MNIKPLSQQGEYRFGFNGMEKDDEVGIRLVTEMIFKALPMTKVKGWNEEMGMDLQKR